MDSKKKTRTKIVRSFSCAKASVPQRLAVIAMRSQGLSYQDIADKFQCGASTIRKLCLEVPSEWTFRDTQLLNELKNSLSSQYLQAANVMLARALDDDKLDKAGTYQLAVASSIMIDKHRLMSGESTSNINLMRDHVKTLDAEVMSNNERIKEIEAELASESIGK